MKIDAGLDTGPMISAEQTPIGDEETAPELSERLAAMGARLLVEALAKLPATPTPQDGSRASLAPILKKEDGRIDWARPASQIYNRMRGFTPWPGSYSTFRGQTCHLWGRPGTQPPPDEQISPGEILATGKEIHVACGAGTRLLPESIQIEGRKKITATEFTNGARLAAGERFS